MIITFVLGFLIGYADCGNGGGISIWPEDDTLSNTPILIFEGYYEHAYIVNEMPSRYPVFLQAGKHKVPLARVDINEGANGQCQLLLKPTEALLDGRQYKLVVEKLPNLKDHFYYDIYDEHNIIKKWRIVRPASNSSPAFVSKPKEQGQKYQQYGCGLEHHVDFACKVDSPTDYLVKTVLTELGSGLVYTYYIEPANGIIAVGRHMCGGAFNLMRGGKYQVEFTLVNASGVYGKTTSGKIEFTTPTVASR